MFYQEWLFLHLPRASLGSSGWHTHRYERHFFLSLMDLVKAEIFAQLSEMHHTSIISSTQNILTDIYHVSGPVLSPGNMMMKMTKVLGRRTRAQEMRFLQQLAGLSSAPTKPSYPLRLSVKCFLSLEKWTPADIQGRKHRKSSFTNTNVEGA